MRSLALRLKASSAADFEPFERWKRMINQRTIDILCNTGDKKMLEKLFQDGVIDSNNRLIPLENRDIRKRESAIPNETTQVSLSEKSTIAMQGGLKESVEKDSFFED